MADYRGKKCLICDKEFVDGDDIVVCPECGTPYHRACYLEKGECVNHELHETGGSWQKQQEKIEEEMRSNDQSGERRCPRCGASNPSNALFCSYCGLPMGVSQQGAQQSFNNNAAGAAGGQPGFGGYNGYGPMGDPMFGNVAAVRFTPDSDLDGNTLGEYANYVGTSRSYFMTQFIRFAKFAKKASFSFAAFLFPEFYFFYRKMYKEAILSFLAMILLLLPSMVYMFNDGGEYAKMMSEAGMGLPSVLMNDINIKTHWFNAVYNICYFGTWIFQAVCGIFANFWYYKKAKKDIGRIKSENLGSDEIARRGGTSMGVMILSFALYMAVTIGMMVLIHYRAQLGL